MSIIDRVKTLFTRKQQSGGLTNSDLTVEQLRQYAQSSGDYGIMSLYGVAGAGGLRNEAVTFAIYFRVVTLISSLMAQLITGGTLRIVDRDGNIDKSGRSNRILDLLQYSPDGRTPAYQFIEDMALDYLIDGNALLSIQRVMGRVSALQRLDSYSALIDYASDGSAVYKAYDAYDFQRGKYNMHSELDVIHARWGLLTRFNHSGGNRALFSTPPVVLMRPALSIGLESDRYILDWYKTDSPKANVGISIQKPLTPQQAEEFYTHFKRSAQSRAPMLFGEGASFTNLNNTSAGSASQSEQRDFQIGEICRVYGIPGPLVNQQVTSWGSGIEQLSKGAFIYGLRQHADRLLAPMKLRLLPKGYQFRVDGTDLLRGDTSGIAALLTSLRGNAQSDEVATIQEQRRLAGLPVNPEYGELQKKPMTAPIPPNDNDNDEDMNDDDGNVE